MVALYHTDNGRCTIGTSAHICSPCVRQIGADVACVRLPVFVASA